MGTRAQRADARLAIVESYRSFKRQHPESRPGGAKRAFCEAYNSGVVSLGIGEVVPILKPQTLGDWLRAYKRDGVRGLDDRRDGARLRGRTSLSDKVIAQVLAMKRENPRAKVRNLHGPVCHYARKEGEREPSYDALRRFLKRWESEHPQLHQRIQHPDRWKSRYMASFGDAAETVVRPNQRWEADGTPADFLIEGRRYTGAILIDVFSRRFKFQLSPTSSWQTICLALRAAILDFGVPESLVTDMGREFANRNLRRVAAQLDLCVEHKGPFKPDEKPFVERVGRTLQHSELELLANFVGHCVSEQQAIRNQKSFAEQLFKKGALIKVSVSADEMQRMVDQWITGVYEQKVHRGLGCNPIEKWRSYAGPLRKIENVRALDALLAPPAGRGGGATVQKHGITLDHTWFIAAELAAHIGQRVELLQDPFDLGRVVVYQAGRFVCVAECPERTGVDRKEIAAHARNLQRRLVSEANRELRERTRGAMKTDALVRDYIEAKAETAGKVVSLNANMRPHDSEGLREAAKAAAALDAPSGETGPTRARPLRDDAAGDLAPVMPLLTSDAERVAHWKKLDSRLRAGQPLTPSETRFHAEFGRGAILRDWLAEERELEGPHLSDDDAKAKLHAARE